MSHRELAWVDVETTGLSHERHEFLEVAVVRTTPALEVLDELNLLVLPEHIETASSSALELNGYDPTLWSATGVSLREALERVLPILEGRTPAGHNVGFDLAFLREGASRVGLRWPQTGHHVVDTVSMAWPLLATGEVERLSLGPLCEALGVRPGGHRAAEDIRATIEVARCLLARWRQNRELAEHAVLHEAAERLALEGLARFPSWETVKEMGGRVPIHIAANSRDEEEP